MPALPFHVPRESVVVTHSYSILDGEPGSTESLLLGAVGWAGSQRRSTACSARAAGQPYRLVTVDRVDQVATAEDLLALGERPVGRPGLAAAGPQGGRRAGGGQLLPVKQAAGDRRDERPVARVLLEVVLLGLLVPQLLVAVDQDEELAMSSVLSHSGPVDPLSPPSIRQRPDRQTPNLIWYGYGSRRLDEMEKRHE